MKRLLWLTLLLAALGCCHRPARAENYPFAGTITYGDNGSDLPVTMTGGGVVFDLTGATVQLVATMGIGGRTFTFTINGDLVSPTEGSCKFEDVGVTARNPGTRGTDTYTAQVKIVKGGETYWTSPFRFSIRKAPI